MLGGENLKICTKMIISAPSESVSGLKLDLHSTPLRTTSDARIFTANSTNSTTAHEQPRGVILDWAHSPRHGISVRVRRSFVPAHLAWLRADHRHLPEQYRRMPTWRQVSTEIAKAAEGEKDLLEICVSLRLVLALEGIECLMK